MLKKNSQFKNKFDRTLLPSPTQYFYEMGLIATGRREWKSLHCPHHRDNRPSLRVLWETGAFRCMSCGVYGGDILSFHMQLYGIPFMDAAKELGAWRESE